MKRSSPPIGEDCRKPAFDAVSRHSPSLASGGYHALPRCTGIGPSGLCLADSEPIGTSTAMRAMNCILLVAPLMLTTFGYVRGEEPLTADCDRYKALGVQDYYITPL